MWFHYGRFASSAPRKGGAKLARSERLLQLSYEALLDPQGHARTLQRMVAFLGVPVTQGALECASLLAENRHIHRDRHAEQQQQAVSLEEAYGNTSFVCQMWRIFQRRASKLSYAPPGGISCSMQ